MDYDKLTRELGHKERTIEDLISYINTRTDDNVPNYSLLLGAGASFTSGISTGETLVSKWRKEIFCKLSKDEEYTEDKAKQYLITYHSNWYSLSNEYSSLFEHKFDLPSQRRRFVEREVDKKLPSIGYSYLVSLAKDRYFDTIYTTNFDDLLNEAFYQFSQTRPIVCAHDSSVNTISVTSKRPKVIKLHGDYLFDDIKSTLRETESLESNIKEKLIQFSKEYGLIVMGYAGNDRSIMDVINYLLKSEAYLKNGIYWCIREGDKINPELTKLLWKDKVYFVKIDGFDESMAQIHHSLKEGFSLKENFTNSKKENIISSFTHDIFNLSNSSKFIKKDIDELKKHKDSMDISNLIRELNEKEFDGSEEDFKILLNSDRLVAEKSYYEAINTLKNHIDGFDNKKSKKFYIRKMINIYSLSNQEDEALILCDKLIEMDPFNLDYFFLKSKNIKKISNRCMFIKENIDKFKNRYQFHNFLFTNAIIEKKNVKGDPFFSTETLSFHVDRSLTLEPSTSNPAYNYRKEIISIEYDGKTDKDSRTKKKKELDKLINTTKEINDQSYNHIKLSLDSLILNCEQKELKKTIDNTINICKASSTNKKNKLIDLICEIFIDFDEYDKQEEIKKDWANFMQSELISSLEKKPLSYLLCDAKYQIQIEKDKDKCIELLLDCIKHKDAIDYMEQIVNIYITLTNDHETITQFIEKESEEIDLKMLCYYKSIVSTYKENFDEAIEFLDESHREGLSLSNYLCKKSFILLKAGKFKKTINLIDQNIDYLLSKSDKDILMINRETASKKLNEPINEIYLRNIIVRKLSKGLVLSAECLLGQKVPAIRMLNTIIENDYYDYFNLKEWPVIPSEYFDNLNIKNKPNELENNKAATN